MMNHFIKLSVLFLVAMGFVFIPMASAGGPAVKTKALLRFPDIHEDMVVFVHGEDIWKVSANGGVATRLTSHDGQERFPKFSPDGQLIAFTGQYDGNSDVYVMNVHGGDITRVTYHPGNDEIIGWHPQKGKILFRSTRSSYSRFSRLYLISPDGSGLEELILHEAAHGSFSPDGNKIAYNKLARENRTWKRYKGGTAQEVYIYDLKTNEDKKVTDFAGTDRIPMWIGDTVYFSSDRDRVLNIYAYNTRTGKTRQLTQHKNYDIRRPSHDQAFIVYEVGGQIWKLNVESGKTQQIPIQILSDAPEVRPYIKDVSRNITGIDVSPSGKRALIVARGEVFSLPAKKGISRNLTNNCGSRDKNAVWSPDGKWIAYLSDKGGEYDIYLTDAKGTKHKKLTSFKDGYRHTLKWSPDSKKIGFTDQTLRLYYINISSKKIVIVDKAEFENVDVSQDKKAIYDYNWSPDSRYIAYSKMNGDLVYQIYIYSLDTGKSHKISHEIFNDFNPVFSPDGNYLFMISNRRFDPTYCDFEWEVVYKNVAGIYCVPLRRDIPSRFPLELNEEGEKATKAKPVKGKGKKGASSKNRIDFQGIQNRVEALSLPAGNYRNMAVNKDTLFYMNLDKGDFNRFEYRVPRAMDLHAYSLKEKKSALITKGVQSYKLSANGAHLIYKKGQAINIIKSSVRKAKGKGINLAGLKMNFNPKKEWKQIFHEAWRLQRDFYYEANMHGLDWPAMRQKYGKLLAAATCRQDIRFIVGELIGELNTSHTYVFGGDRQRRAKRQNVGMLGVDWQVDTARNLYRFKKIYKVPDWTRNIMPPLAKPGIKVLAGDYLLKVNGKPVTAKKNVYSYFLDLAGKTITLTVNKKPTMVGAVQIAVKPLSGERTLRYQTWVEHNRQLVNQVSKGQIGYFHLPDTYLGSSVEFPKYFYSQTRKKGLIVDGRFNGGGLDPDIFLQRLDKKTHAYWTRRHSHDQTIPAVVTRAHLVCLTNRQAGSGGDMLPMEFQMRKMGPVIGTRTWGGLVGVSMFIAMIDGGGLTAPDYRIYDPKGNWIVENQGVKPDIVVDLKSTEMAKGYDAQLMKGVEVLMDKIKKDPRPWPKHKAFQVDK